MSMPRGFSTNTAKYSEKGGLTVSKVRVPDDSEEGLAAAISEIEQRKKRAGLTWQTPFPGPMKPVGIAKGPYKGMELVGEDLEGGELRAEDGDALARAAIRLLRRACHRLLQHCRRYVTGRVQDS